LARRGGIKRIAGDVYPEIMSITEGFLATIIKDALCYMHYAKRNTVIIGDLICAIKRHGKSFVGSFWDVYFWMKN